MDRRFSSLGLPTKPVLALTVLLFPKSERVKEIVDDGVTVLLHLELCVSTFVVVQSKTFGSLSKPADHHVESAQKTASLGQNPSQ